MSYNIGSFKKEEVTIVCISNSQYILQTWSQIKLCLSPMSCEWLAFIIVVNHYTSSLLSKCLLHVQCRFAGGSKGETLCPCNNPLSVFNIWVVAVNRTILPKVITVHILWMFTWNCLECYDNQIISLAVVFHVIMV